MLLERIQIKRVHNLLSNEDVVSYAENDEYNQVTPPLACLLGTSQLDDKRHWSMAFA